MATTLSFRCPALGGREAALVQCLRERGSRDPGISAAAEGRLADLAPSVAELVALLTDHNPFVRSGAAWWLRNVGEELSADAVESLRAAVYDPNPHVVQAALGTCGVRRVEAVRDDARSALASPNAAVAHSAIFALGRIGPAEEGALLVPFLRAPERHLELAAVVALTNLRYAPAVPELIARLEEYRGQQRRVRAQFELPRRYLQALVALRAREAVPLLVEMAREEVGLRGLAVQALIDLEAAEAAPALVPLLRQLFASTHEEKLCCSLLYLMTRLDYRFAVEDVRRFLEHRLPGVRCAALKAVARWRDEGAVGAVRALAIGDPSAFVRPCAVAALADLLGAEAPGELAGLVDDANALVRAAVAEALARLTPRPPAARELLERLAADPAGAVARQAAEALQEAGPHEAAEPPEPGPAALPAALRTQAQAARAFLRAWQASAGGELAAALAVALGALE